MTFIELCELTHEFVSRVPVAYESVELGRGGDGAYAVPDPEQRRVIRAVRDAYRQILGLSSHWDFLHARRLFFTTEAGKERYSGVDGDIWKRSMFISRVGRDVRLPLHKGEYRWWVEMERMGLQNQGQPNKLVEAPNGDAILWPVPNGAFEVWGDAFETAPMLELAIDEPLWDADLHDVVADVAVQRLNMQLDSSEELVQRLNVADARIRASTKIQEMLRRYTGEFEL